MRVAYVHLHVCRLVSVMWEGGINPMIGFVLGAGCRRSTPAFIDAIVRLGPGWCKCEGCAVLTSVLVGPVGLQCCRCEKVGMFLAREYDCWELSLPAVAARREERVRVTASVPVGLSGGMCRASR